jgi:hypothetical protein
MSWFWYANIPVEQVACSPSVNMGLPQGSDGVLDSNRKDFALGTLGGIEELSTYVEQWRYFVGEA